MRKLLFFLSIIIAGCTKDNTDSEVYDREVRYYVKGYNTDFEYTDKGKLFVNEHNLKSAFSEECDEGRPYFRSRCKKNEKATFNFTGDTITISHDGIKFCKIDYFEIEVVSVNPDGKSSTLFSEKAKMLPDGKFKITGTVKIP
ncbi:MAG: hypothetical protein ACXWDO_01165 [Bacteroidia bacterium]